MFRLALAAVLLTPLTAAAQPWLEAYEARDYARAAILLQEFVSDPVHLDTEPEAFETLARMYRDGLGVERNPANVCALAIAADGAYQMSPRSRYRDMEQRQSALTRISALVESSCSSIPTEQRDAAMSNIGCFAFGLNEQPLVVGPYAVHVTRAGLWHDNAATTGTDMRLTCPAVVSSVRAISVSPPPGAPPSVRTRNFVELWYWTPAKRSPATAQRFTPVWAMFEVHERSLSYGTEELLPASTWPSASFSPPVVSFEMTRAGHIRWVIEGAPPRRGWLMLEHNR